MLWVELAGTAGQLTHACPGSAQARHLSGAPRILSSGRAAWGKAVWGEMCVLEGRCRRQWKAVHSVKLLARRGCDWN